MGTSNPSAVKVIVSMYYEKDLKNRILFITLNPLLSGFGICLRGSNGYKQGIELRFEPKRQKVDMIDVCIDHQ